MAVSRKRKKDFALRSRSTLYASASQMSLYISVLNLKGVRFVF